jgi:hypothetical protein
LPVVLAVIVVTADEVRIGVLDVPIVPEPDVSTKVGVTSQAVPPD